jgi:hypothetical protein
VEVGLLSCTGVVDGLTVLSAPAGLLLVDFGGVSAPADCDYEGWG